MTFAGFVAHLALVRAALPDAEKAGLDHAGHLIEQEAKDLIGTEYSGWPALADSTVARKSALGQTGRKSATDPLLATGELLHSVHHEVDGHKVIVGTPDPVGVFHEFGTSRMPPRPFLAPAAHRKGEAAANAIGAAVGHALAGKPAAVEGLTVDQVVDEGHRRDGQHGGDAAEHGEHGQCRDLGAEAGGAPRRFRAGAVAGMPGDNPSGTER